MSQPWPPPPDLHSIRELVATADVESFIADGAPEDEYETEAEMLFEQLKGLATAELTPEKIRPVLEDIWIRNFTLAPDQLLLRGPALLGLAQQISRFFGPEAQPHVRNQVRGS